MHCIDNQDSSDVHNATRASKSSGIVSKADVIVIDPVSEPIAQNNHNSSTDKKDNIELLFSSDDEDENFFDATGRHVSLGKQRCVIHCLFYLRTHVTIKMPGVSHVSWVIRSIRAEWIKWDSVPPKATKKSRDLHSSEHSANIVTSCANYSQLLSDAHGDVVQYLRVYIDCRWSGDWILFWEFYLCLS